jgi:hypothetical protein
LLFSLLKVEDLHLDEIKEGLRQTDLRANARVKILEHSVADLLRELS